MKVQTDEDFEALLDYIRESRGFDFSGYKRATLVRRVGKRLAELRLESYSAYQDYLQVHAAEFPILFDHLLINVTDFFRDREAWTHLAREVVPRLLAKRSRIRIWSTGTASGEEAYTAAMVFCEALGEQEFLRRVKIYATDVDEDALGKARTGYTEKEIEAVEPELRSRYFEPTAGKLTFRQSLRRALIFGRHDLMQDAPISRLDLLICRNTLMYFTADAQSRILARFHYALNDDGFLFLGRAEMLLTRASLFTPINLKHRVFAKVPKLEPGDRMIVLAQAGGGDAGDQLARQIRLRELSAEGSPSAQIVVDAGGAVAIVNHLARQMFDIGPRDIGRPLRDLEVSYKPVDLRTPIDRVMRDRSVVALSGVSHVQADGSVRQLDIQVVPLIDDDRTLVGIALSYQDVTQMMQLRTEIERSRHEVETAYEELQSSNEELETTNEELQSTVEELETTNEELETANEELETANEELETSNSDLQAINADIHSRSDEIDKLNAFLQAITGKIPISAVVVDRKLVVRVWNEHAADMWGLRSDEAVGKQLLALDIGLPVNELRDMLRAVIRGRPPTDQITVDAVNRRGRKVKCLVTASALPGPTAGGAVVLVEEQKARAPKG